jgi:hypothetical protein
MKGSLIAGLSILLLLGVAGWEGRLEASEYPVRPITCVVPIRREGTRYVRLMDRLQPC